MTNTKTRRRQTTRHLRGEALSGRFPGSAAATVVAAVLLAVGIPQAYGGPGAAGARSAKPAAVTNAPAPTASSNAAVSVDTIRALLSKWVEAEQLAAKESREAQQTKDILTARIDILKEGIASLNEKLAQADEKLAQAQKQKADVVAQIDENTLVAAQLTADVAGLEAGIRGLHARLPTPLTDKIRTLYERMPADTNTVRVSVAERCQNVLGILNEVNKFNAEIAMVYDVRTLSDGRPSEVSCAYIGLGQAYSVSPRGEAAVGRPGTNGWAWMAVPASAESITVTLEILQSKAKPNFVPLPVELE